MDDCGQIDRKALGSLVFGDEAKLQQLNQLVWPAIRSRIEEALVAMDAAAAQAAPGAARGFVFVEAAVLVEAKWADLFDEVWCVSAPAARREERAIARGRSAESVAAIMARQCSDAQREAVANRVISNAGSWEELYSAVTAAVQKSGAQAFGDAATAAALAAGGPLAEGPLTQQQSASAVGDEIITHVNEKDEVLGGISRSKMRQQNLWHRATFIFVRRSGGEFIIQKRTDTKDYMPGAWDVPTGGVVSYNEEWMPSAQRELQEELGIPGAKAGLRWCFKFPYEDEHTKCWAGVLDCVWDGPLQLQESEVAATAEVAKDAVYRMQAKGAQFTPDGLYALQLYQEWIKRGRPNMPILPGNKEQQVWANRAANDFGGSPLLAELTGDEKAKTPAAAAAAAKVGASAGSEPMSWVRIALIGAAVVGLGLLAMRKTAATEVPSAKD